MKQTTVTYRNREWTQEQMYELLTAMLDDGFSVVLWHNHGAYRCAIEVRFALWSDVEGSGETVWKALVAALEEYQANKGE